MPSPLPADGGQRRRPRRSLDEDIEKLSRLLFRESGVPASAASALTDRGPSPTRRIDIDGRSAVLLEPSPPRSVDAEARATLAAAGGKRGRAHASSGTGDSSPGVLLRKRGALTDPHTVDLDSPPVLQDRFDDTRGSRAGAAKAPGPTPHSLHSSGVDLRPPLSLSRLVRERFGPPAAAPPPEEVYMSLVARHRSQAPPPPPADGHGGGWGLPRDPAPTQPTPWSLRALGVAGRAEGDRGSPPRRVSAPSEVVPSPPRSPFSTHGGEASPSLPSPIRWAVVTRPRRPERTLSAAAGGSHPRLGRGPVVEDTTPPPPLAVAQPSPLPRAPPSCGGAGGVGGGSVGRSSTARGPSTRSMVAPYGSGEVSSPAPPPPRLGHPSDASIPLPQPHQPLTSACGAPAGQSSGGGSVLGEATRAYYRRLANGLSLTPPLPQPCS